MIPVIDISEHQGAFNFNTAAAQNVKGIIIRATHGLTVDARLSVNVQGALAAGYDDTQLGFYTFCNPKRGTPEACARKFVDIVRYALGHLDTVLMLDVESYVNETPNKGVKWMAPVYAAWLRVMRAEVERLAPEATVIMYTNAAYWNPEVGATDFGDMDIIAARYPYYSFAACAAHPVPHDAETWDEWILAETTKRPIVPNGWDTWDGWQFSAGYNQMGATYGASSRDLDLNIVHPDAWARWTKQEVTYTETTATALEAATGDTMLTIIAQTPEVVLGKRWVWNGMVKFSTTEAQAQALSARGAFGAGPGSRLDWPVVLSAEEVAAIPTVGA